MTKKAQKTKKNSGFTLVELLLYVAISGAILIIVSVFVALILQSRVKNQTVSEVEMQGAQIINTITQTIRNAEEISSPSPSMSAASSSINVITETKDPTIFQLNNETIEITEGGGPSIALHNDRVIASNLLFQNLSIANTPGTIRISFTLTHVNTENRIEYNFSRDFHASATIR